MLFTKIISKNINYSYFEIKNQNMVGTVCFHLFGDVFGQYESLTREISKIVNSIIDGIYSDIIYTPGNFSFIVEMNETAYMYYGSTSNFPLYYYNNGLTFTISNDFEVLATYLGLLPSSQKIAYLVWGGDCLPYDNINILKADNIIKFDKTNGMLCDVYEHKPYEYNLLKTNFNECCDYAKRLVVNAVENVSKYKNIGLALSGGMDSSVIAACLKRAGAEFECFHWTSTKYHEIDETRYIGDLRDMYDLKVHYIDISSGIENNDGYIDCHGYYRIPYNHSSYSWWKKTIEKAKEQDIKYLFTGYKGDSLFSSTFSLLNYYDWKYSDKEWLLQYWLNSFSIINRRQYTDLNNVDINKFELCFSRGGEFLNSDMLKCEKMKSNVFQNSTFTYQMESMKYNLFDPEGVKLLSPYSDKRLLEFACSIPHFYKSIPIAGQIMHKPVLRNAFNGILPFSIYSRNSKSNFGILVQKFCQHNRNFIRDLLLDNSILEQEKIIIRDKLINTLDNQQAFMRSANVIARACYIEIWLRRLNATKNIE